MNKIKKNNKKLDNFKKIINSLETEKEILVFVYFTFPIVSNNLKMTEYIKKNRKQVALKLYKKDKVSLERASEIAGEPLEKIIKYI